MAPLRRLIQGRATIVISHNLATVREASSILVLDRGRVAEEGAHSELLLRDGLYARLYRLHQGEWESEPTRDRMPELAVEA